MTDHRPRQAVDAVHVPFITRDQMIEVDRVMIEDLGISLVQMMENAGRNLARLTMDLYISGGRAGRVVVLAGSGGNGGGGIVAARRLAGWDVPVSIWTTKPVERYEGVIASQLHAATAAGVAVNTEGFPANGNGTVLLDCLIGYSLKGSPRGRVADLIEWAVTSRSPIVSLDVPSGIDATTGQPADPAIIADVTMTLALPKTGLREEDALGHVGALHIADIAVPASVYRDSFGIEVGDLFTRSDIVELRL